MKNDLLSKSANEIGRGRQRNIDRYLRARDAAAYIGLAVSTLAKMRMNPGAGPSFTKAGPRVVLYERADLDAWLSSRKRNSTSECRGAK